MTSRISQIIRRLRDLFQENELQKEYAQKHNYSEPHQMYNMGVVIGILLSINAVEEMFKKEAEQE